jgi:hypothetical protein
MPDGRRCTTPSQRQQLLADLNALIAANKPVHHVAVVVEPWVRKLRSMSIQVCDGNDDIDPDFAADIKVKL